MTQSPPPLNYALQPRSPVRFRTIFGCVLFILLAIMLFVLVQGKNRQFHGTAVSDFESFLEQGVIRTITVQGDEVYGDLLSPTRAADGSLITNYRTSFPTGMTQSWAFMEHVLHNRGGARVYVENDQNLLLQVLVPLIPWLLIFGFIWFFVFRQLRGRSGQPQQPLPVIVVNQPPPLQ
jgi:ATP-dependent Zn protease